MNKVITVFLILALCIPLVHAHLDEERDGITNERRIHMGYSPSKITSNSPVLISLVISNDTQNTGYNYYEDIIKPESILIRVSSDEQYIFSGQLHPGIETTDFVYTFPVPGHYNMEVSAKLFEGDVLTHTFNFDVHKRPTKNYFSMAIGIILVIALWYIIRKK